MTRTDFMNDLQELYDELSRRQEELGGYLRLAEGKSHPEAEKTVEEFLDLLKLRKKPETIMAILDRLVNLREDSLEQVMKHEKWDEEKIISAKEKAYFFVGDFYLQRFESLIVYIEEKELLSPFYRSLISGVHAVGLAISRWQNGWTSHIIHGTNRDLLELFNGDEEKIFEMLREKKLLDLHKGREADRCYSVLVMEKEGYRRLSYAEAFKKEIEEVENALDALIETMEGLQDYIFGQKKTWLDYFRALKRAFLHTEPDEMVEYWADVDRAWMKITAPLQVGHPLEYYEDHYRKAVALEWDLRITNPRLQAATDVREHISASAADLAVKLGPEAEKIFAGNVDQIKRTQLYIGQPALFYGAEFNGLFSAQVVPNDEEVSRQFGKKIFAYADFVRRSHLAKPVMRLSMETFGEEFIRRRQKLLKDPERWNRLYEIGTVGHEFGHILWMDSDTEVSMNRTGQFKNIEEFKATAGGLMAFFDNDAEELRTDILEDLASRAVGLMAWREVGEVRPYYCEGLIHLELLYRAGAIKFEGIRVEIDPLAYETTRQTYRDAYTQLAEHYVSRRDASEYLYRYIGKNGNAYLPTTPGVKEFVETYYSRYLEIGQQVIALNQE
jgi:hypothetical protein